MTTTQQPTLTDLQTALTVATDGEFALAFCDMIYRNALDLHDNMRSLVREIERVKRDADQALTNLANGYSVNSLGIFQSSADAADRLAAERDLIVRSIKSNVFLIKRLLGDDTEFTFDAVVAMAR